MSTTNSEIPSSPEEKWTAYLDGKLSAQDAAAFERENPAAAAEHALHARIASAVRLHSPSPKLRNADFFNGRILAEISVRPATTVAPAKRRLWPLWRIAAACCLIAGLVIYGTSAFRPEPPAPVPAHDVASAKTDDRELSVTVLDANGKKVLLINDLEQLSSEYVLR
jgi:anti-sigma factor RsiW